jgi:glycosyltransferase involved in cell wall biosynthesis
MPLLSDHRAELAEIFPEGLGVTLGGSEAALSEAAAVLARTPDRELRAQGRELHKRFAAEHTWEARWKQIADCPAPRTEISSLTTVSWTPARREADWVPQVA